MVRAGRLVNLRLELHLLHVEGFVVAGTELRRHTLHVILRLDGTDGNRAAVVLAILQLVQR